MAESVEIWKDVEYNIYTAERYAVSMNGRIKNKNTGYIFKPRLYAGKSSVGLQIGNGRNKIFSVNSLVTAAFGMKQDLQDSKLAEYDKKEMNGERQNKEFVIEIRITL